MIIVVSGIKVEETIAADVWLEIERGHTLVDQA